ncbi:hypothetical protein EJ06DRAFT_524934 [Trichodelitschia bisporula]|uniref:Galactose oxidase n=1 Tax=Trichodelitschia bisporula TaxID=703511 RepID=A0A6G1HJN3_9PEZI|nr:hypothetical protein EJ06DRAFT_524934 [Trichodelitschia bisporula]
MDTVKETVNTTLQRTNTLIASARDTISTRSTAFAGTASETSTSLLDQARSGLQRSGTLISTTSASLLNRTGALTQDVSSASTSATSSLKRTGTLLGNHSATALKRTGTFAQRAAAASPILQSAGVWAGSAATNATTYAKSWYEYPTSVRATLSPVPGVQIRRVGAAVAVVAGRTYVFGGEILGPDAGGEDDGNDLTTLMIVLPSSGVHEADYTTLAARPRVAGGPVPQNRVGATAVTVGPLIFLFGGQILADEDDEDEDEDDEDEGRMWIFDTHTRRWDAADVRPDAVFPRARWGAAAVAAEDPGLANSEGELEPGTYGTVFIYGGFAGDDDAPETLHDVWAFDVRTRAWIALPPPPGPARVGAHLAVAAGKVFLVGGGREVDAEIEGSNVALPVDALDAQALFAPRARGEAKLHLPGVLSTALGDGRAALLVVGSGGKIGIVDVSAPKGPRAAGTDTEDEDEGVVTGVVGVDAAFVDQFGDELPLKKGVRLMV